MKRKGFLYENIYNFDNIELNIFYNYCDIHVVFYKMNY